MAGWTDLRELVAREFDQAKEEGKSAAALDVLRGEFSVMGKDQIALESVFARILALPVADDFPFREPSELQGIKEARQNRRTMVLPALDTTLEDKLHGAWLGRCVGCALGKPVELIGIHPPEAVRQYTWRDIKRYLTAINPQEWPVRDYIPRHSPAEGELMRLTGFASTREVIAYMESDDDIRYTVLGQLVLMEKGGSFTTEDVADKWLQKLPYRAVCTAETQAYRNLVVRYDTHESTRWSVGPRPIDWTWVATHLNPYREWIGAQIRVDSCGYAAPGLPEMAAEFAWRDARLSHVKNGIYGAMFCAAMIAAAFASDDVREIIAAGLGEIPATSRLHAEMIKTIAVCHRFDCDFGRHAEIFDGVWDLVGKYSNIHTISNAAVCVTALLLSRGDYHLGITTAVMAGFDTDCNAATVGSILGAMTGARSLPAHWTDRLNNTLNSEIAGYHPIAISECASRSYAIVQKLRNGN